MAFCLIGRHAAKKFLKHLADGMPASVRWRREQVAKEVSGKQACDQVDQTGKDEGPCGLEMEIPAPSILVGHYVTEAGGDRIA